MSGAPSVWAPNAGRVELVLGDERLPMRADDAGWWHAARSLAPGMDYAFALDGGSALPDPRSPSQPHGVHGVSRTVDHAAFAWGDAGWSAPPLADGVIYELHVGTFTAAGTFDAAIARLDDLVRLGITHVELLPVCEFSGDRGWGYDGVDLFAPHRAYGGPDGLKRLVDAAHRRGLAILVDVVYNHLGPEGNYLARFGPYFTDRYVTPWGDAVNFDGPGSDEVRRFVVDNACMWLRDYHADGLRIDAMQAIFDMRAIHIGEEIAAAVHDLGAALGRRLIVTAESDLNDPRLVRPPEAGGYGFDAIWADDVHHAFHATLTGEASGYYADFTDPQLVAEAMHEPFLYADRYQPTRGRRFGRPPGDLPGDRFVAFLQNHDQVGNRARGDRLAALAGPGRARIGAALLFTAPYVPLLFQGEAWGTEAPFAYFTGHESDALADAVRRGRRQEFAAFGWDAVAIPDPQAPDTHSASVLPWVDRDEPEHGALLDWHTALIRLRRDEPALRDGDRGAVHATLDADHVLRVERGPVTVLANLGAATRSAPVDGEIVVAWPSGATVDDGVVTLPPDGVVVARAGSQR